MPFKEIQVDELYEVDDRILIDVRSPSEFAEGSIPGAVNIPLFTDEERAQIGTVYKQQSPAAARRLAMLTVSPKIPELVEQMEKLLPLGQLVIFCWRGGMRSFAACTFMDLLKYPIKRLRGGYRAYRQLVVDRLARIEGLENPLIVLHGLTGVGKSRILTLLQERGEQVLDLEKMANHRGSVFGAIGLGRPSNQKTFEAQLWEAVRTIEPGRPVFMEAESRRIGFSTMPLWLDKDKHEGIPVLVEASLEMRVQNLIEDYLPAQNESVRTALAQALSTIQKRIRREDFTELQDMLTRGDYSAFTAMILQTYYDPKYLHKLKEYPRQMITVNADDLEVAADRLTELADQVMVQWADHSVRARFEPDMSNLSVFEK